MRTVQTGPVVGLVFQLVLLGALARTVGLGPWGLAVGVACAATLTMLLLRALRRQAGATRGLGPAGRVTLTRASLVVGVAALTAESSRAGAPSTSGLVTSGLGTPVVATLVALSTVALVLDAVDGRVARRTGTQSAFGARFDMEIDAFLILVLSVYVAPAVGIWVLAIGAARYAFVAAGWVLPWLRGQAPARYWAKVVAAVQGIVLTVVAADVVPQRLEVSALVAALVLLAESFGRDVWWLWRHRPVVATSWQARSDAFRHGPVRVAAGALATTVALLLVWYALLAPNELDRLGPGAFVRVPLEGLLFVALVLVLPPRGRRAAALVFGALLGLLTVVKVLDMGFLDAIGRTFDPVVDWRYAGSAAGLLDDSVGQPRATLLLVAAALLAVAVLVLLPLSVLRLARVAHAHRVASARAVLALGSVWVVGALLGVEAVPGVPLASTSAAALASEHVSRSTAGFLDERSFAQTASHDSLAGTPTADLLTGLRGKDVLVVFVESYGRIAVQGSAFSPRIDSVLDQGTAALRSAGFSARSAFLTSPTFGGISWLAHSTLQSGLWVDDQRRYDELVAGNRFTLSDAFKRAGWRTVADVPSNERTWPEGRSFYHYDAIYDEHNVGYVGPHFSYAAMPDQYTLAAFQRLELGSRHRAPVMAEIDLVSSHTPWAPLPRMVPWAAVGDGSVFDPMPAQGASPDLVWRNADDVRAAYGQSIEYSLQTLVSFVQTVHDPNLVLVVLGDHQPFTIVSGHSGNHDVPVSVISHDPTVLDRISGWGWQPGLRPHSDAPVWRMDAFRDRFLKAYDGTAIASATP